MNGLMLESFRLDRKCERDPERDAKRDGKRDGKCDGKRDAKRERNAERDGYASQHICINVHDHRASDSDAGIDCAG